MTLEEYWRKRDFGHTPEPRGAVPGTGKAPERRFVVQRHRASRLHYDLRLEIGGVLVSWAVPRGPSMRPLSRRYAARTEDHPLEYLRFEGVIPAGEYGAGDVIVWDLGTWQHDGPDEPDDALAAGELKLILHGRRLQGRFVLVRTATSRHSREDWLLIRKRDEHSDPTWDIRDHGTSVLSGRTNEQVAGRQPARSGDSTPWPADLDLSAARQAALPSFVPPMLATAVDRPFSAEEWLFEPKLDGYRVQAVVQDGAVRLRTRNGRDAAGYFPAFAAAPADWMAAGEAVVDGEMVALDEAGRPSFSLLQGLAGGRAPGPHGARPRVAARSQEPPSQGTLVYHVFDLLHLDGLDLQDVPLEARKRLLRAVLHEHRGVRYLGHVLEHGVDFQRAVAEQGLEGSVAKLRRSRYEPGVRSRSWLKVKLRREQDVVLVGYEPGHGSHRDLGALLVATRAVDGWRFAGQVGSGMDEPTRSLLRLLLDEHPVVEPPVRGAPSIPDARWCEPRHVIRVEFAEWTPEGVLRHAVYRGRELGRDPETVTREQVERLEGQGRGGPSASATTQDTATEQADARVPSPPRARSRTEMAEGAPAPSRRGLVLELVRSRPGRHGPAEAVTAAELEALEALGDDGRWQVGGHEVDLTNLGKVLFPEVGLTKRDLVRYYATIAPVILPYLRDRPLNVHRWPDGVTGRTQFWQKQIPGHAPDWVSRWDLPDAGRGRSRTYVVADRVATLAWLANQAVIDLHPWTSRLPEHWRPTYALVDIDPGERTAWTDVLTLARLFRTALQHLGVTGHPKVSGKRGLQVWIHVEPRYTFEDTRGWVEALSRGVAAVVPELVSWEWGKADRGGRARLDYTQNSMIKTLVAPYAVRPVASAAVSAPITWEELDDPDLRPDRWDVRSIIGRVETRGDLFAGVLAEPQRLQPLS